MILTKELKMKRRRAVTKLLHAQSRANVTDREVAEMFGCHQTAISSWRNGGTPTGDRFQMMPEVTAKLERIADKANGHAKKVATAPAKSATVVKKVDVTVNPPEVVVETTSPMRFCPRCGEKLVR